MGISILRVMTKFNKVLFSLLIFFGLTLLSSSAIAKEDRVSRGDFVQMLARHNPENALLPKNHSDLSKDELYIQIVEALKIKGFNVLADKPINDPLKTLEFVRITYAFTGAPSGTSLFEQKLYLKKAGIIKSADIGLATGIEGEVIQYYKGEISGNPLELASPIFADDRITNGVVAKSSFTFDDGSVLTLGEEAVVNISKHIYDPEKNFRQMVINVSMGAVKFVVTKAQSKNSMFKVVTPSVTASVRGTEFVIIVGKDGATQVVGIEGEIETAPILPDGTQGQRRPLLGGETQDISPKGVASEVKTAPSHVIKAAQEKTSNPREAISNKGISLSEAEKAAVATSNLSKSNDSRPTEKFDSTTESEKPVSDGQHKKDPGLEKSDQKGVI